MTSEMNRTLGVEEKSINNCVCSRKRQVNGSRTARIWQVVAPLLFVAFGLFGVNENAWGWDGTYTVTMNSKPTAGGYVSNSNNFSAKATSATATGHCNGINWKKSATASTTLYAQAASGYTFTGWSTKEDGSNIVSTSTSYTRTSESMNFVSTSKSETLYAIFTPTYTIRFNGNGNTGGSMSNLSMVYGTAQALTSNGFSKVFTVSYNADGGTTATTTDANTKVTYSFDGWEDRGSIVYNNTTYSYTSFDAPYYANTYSDLKSAFGYDKYSLIQHYINNGNGEGRSCKGSTPGLYPKNATVNNMSTTPGATVDLYAHWSASTNYVILPSATKSGCVLEGWYNGDVNVPANKVGVPGDHYAPTASATTLKAKWIAKYDFEITGSNYTINNEAWTQTSAFTFIHADEANMTTTIQKPDVISYNRASNTITALKIGTSKITFTQNTSSTVKNGSLEWTITVDSVANTLAVSGASFTRYVEQEVTSVRSGQNSNGTITTTSSNPNLAHYDIANNKIVIPNSDAQTLPLDDVTITISQAATAKYKAKRHTITLTVQKYTNTLYANSSATYKPTMQMGKDLAVTLTATNTDYTNSPIQLVEQTVGDNTVAVFDYTQNTHSGTVHSKFKKDVTATWSFHQDENYKYQEANNTFSVDVKMAAEATDCYVLANQSGDQSVWHGETCHEHTWSDENAAGVVHFQIYKNGGSIDPGYKVQQYLNGEWVDVTSKKTDLTTDWTWKSENLALAAKGVRIWGSGSLYNHVKNVYVTRKTYLNASDLTIDQTSAGAPVYPSGEKGVGTLKIDYSLANGGNLKISNDNPSKFTLSQTTISNVDCKTGTANITIEYASTAAGTDYAHLVIYNDVYRKEVTITGKTVKGQPTVNWSSDADYFNVEEVLSATNANGLTVTLSSTGNEDYVSCEGNEATMLQATDGTITITAHVTGNEFFEDRDITKDITITNKTKQTITWEPERDFSRLKTTDGTKTITLNATASSGLPVTYELVGDKTGLTLTQNGNTWTLTYSSECKNTTIVASQAGNGTYAPASAYSLPVKVIDPTKVCDESETLVNSTVNIKENSVTYNIDIPNKMYVSVSRTKQGLIDIYLVGVDFEFYSGRNGTGTKLYTKSYSASNINKSISNSEIDLSSYINAKSVKVVTTSSNGYNINSITYTHQKYCNISTNSLDFNTHPNTQTAALTFDVSYANYPISLECSNNKFSFTPAEFGDCSEYGTQPISVSYTAGSDEGSDDGYIYVKDNTGTTLKTCTLNVAINKMAQSITSHNIETSYNTTDEVTLSAEANSGLTAFTYSATPAGIAVFDGSKMTFLKSGTIAITVTQSGNDVYAPTSTTIQNVKVSKVTPVLTAPTAANEITYGAALSTLSLTGGSAARQDETNVPGTYAWQNGTQVLSAGTHSDVVVVFTPSDTARYTTNTATVSVTVNKQALSVTADNKGVTYGDDAPANSVQYAGFVNSETSAVLGGTLDYDCSYAAGSAVGTYDIMPKGLTSSNYAITFSKGTLTVGKKTLTVTADNKNISYGAAAPTTYTASYEGFAGEDTEAVLGGKLAFACDYEAGDNVGSYDITPSGLTSGNYAFNYVAGTLHVGKAAATVTAPTAKELTYNGSAQALINAGSTEHGDILYKLGSGDWSADVPTATNAGNYTVSYKVVADANHNDVAETAVANVAIAKATPEVTAPTAINPEYTGLAQNLVNAGSTTGGTLQYSLLPSAAYSPSIPQAAFIGTYIVYYRVVGNDNYNSVDPAYISATIARPAISIVNSSSWDDVSDSTSVRIPGSTNIVIDEAVSLYSLTIEAGSKLTIAPTGSLRLGKGGITGAAKDSLVLQAVTDATKASSETLGQTSALIFSPDYEGEMPVAKVEMYSVGYKDLSGATDRDEWQYVGIPIAKADYAAKDAFPKSWVYSWNEATDSWVNNRSTLKLQPFVGVATTQYRDANGYKMTFEGQLADNRGIKEVPLTHAGEGWNLIANSFAGPIDVTKLTVEDFGGAEATIHIWDTKEDQYIELPVGSIKGLDDRQHVIPSMQAFFVQTTAATTLTLDYNRLVWGGEESNVPLKAKRNGQSESSLNGRMSISLTDGVSTDNLCLLESQNYATAYENGYDAPKKFSEANVNAIYALEDERALSVDATNSIAGTRLGLRTTGSGSYLMMFTRVEGSDDWYLLDKQTGAQMLIQEGADYEFEVESGAPVDDRFEIVGPAAAPGVATDVENSDVAEKAVKYLDNNILIIQRKGTKYNSLGQKIQ